MLSNQRLSDKSINLKNLNLLEKISLVEDIWDDISSSQENFEVSEEQKKEIDLRLSSYQLNPNDSKTWNIVREDIKSKL